LRAWGTPDMVQNGLELTSQKSRPSAGNVHFLFHRRGVRASGPRGRRPASRPLETPN
jgi:hypothetical protein